MHELFEKGEEIIRTNVREKRRRRLTKKNNKMNSDRSVHL